MPEQCQSYAPSLALFGIGLVFFTVHYLMLRGFYALERTRTVFWIQCAVSATNIVVALVLVGLAADGRFAGLHSATLATALVAPGLALAPDAIADLLRRAPGRRRITVTRVTR